MTNQQQAVKAAQAHREAHGASILTEFFHLLGMPNVSRDLEDVAGTAAHVVGLLERRGVDVRTVQLGNAAPVIVGHLKRAGATTTIGFYVHYDGQPVDQPGWLVEPFEPTLVTGVLGEGEERSRPTGDEAIDPEWRIYARSASDDKAPVQAICTALDAMAAADLTPTANLVFLFEGEEEIGSPHLRDYLIELQDELAADAWLICDGPVHPTRRPQIVFGWRGISEIEITAYGPIRPLHSGHYGNWAFNPTMALAQLLASMKDDSGNVTIDGFSDDTAEITDADLAAVAALPETDQAMAHELGLGATEDRGTAHALRMLIPSLNIRGFDGGAVGAEAANVIPTEATASIDIRLAPGNDPEGILDRVEAHIEAQGWTIVREEPDAETRRSHSKVARVRRDASYAGARTRVDSPLAVALLGAAEVAAGEPVVAMPTLGGSVPVHHFIDVLDTPVAITPFANHDNNQHAANENIRIANLWYGIDLMAALLTLEL
ncbi:MAG: M20/M25/M40 family metallo-hydrolase [Acidimicrobiia bacterium]|nr:M20/M25/M40 family metallo-hydrolase [Acidimicrobiia bacterium]NNC73875.1 M20/M25/M40 family metallo-hydrolase [Acidimicrobiia bacterium]